MGHPRIIRALIALCFAPSLLAQQEPDPPPVAPVTEPQNFQWKPALLQSLLFLGIQHSTRFAAEKTRDQLDGKWFKDYIDSASNIHTWNDGNSILTNYIGHPIMGGIAGYIQIFNDPKGRKLVFDAHSHDYWSSRLKAMAWAAAYSTQFEIGPLGEASIGNVGKISPTMAVVDLVVTPIGGFILIVLEDWLDKKYVSRWEHVGGKKARVLRVVLNPTRSLANGLRWHLPSYRDTRPRP